MQVLMQRHHHTDMTAREQRHLTRAASPEGKPLLPKTQRQDAGPLCVIFVAGKLK